MGDMEMEPGETPTEGTGGVAGLGAYGRELEGGRERRGSGTAHGSPVQPSWRTLLPWRCPSS